MRFSLGVAVLLSLLLLSPRASAVTFFVDFTSDVHDGAGGASNGTADWIDELDEMATTAGVDIFTPTERSTIESEIVSQLMTMYSGYSVSFTTTMPGSGLFDTINMGLDNASFSALGIAPVDVANISSSQTASVATGNFDFVLDEFTGSASRATQISQIATALAGTGGHEAAHSLGLLHHHAYGVPEIEPGKFSDTMDIQDAHVIGTGSTGLTEVDREVERTFSQWSRALFDITGGAAGAFGGGFDHESMVTAPVLLDTTSEEGAPDAGTTLATATPITFTPGETSGLPLKFLAGDLDGSGADVDWFSFTAPGPGRVIAEIFSDNRFAGPFDFDAELMLLDSTGTPLFANDDVFYDGNVFDSGTFRQDDPFLLNAPIPSAGTFIISVGASISAEDGDAYWLLVGLDSAPLGPGVIPEPGSAVLLLGFTCAGLLFRRRR